MNPLLWDKLVRKVQSGVAGIGPGCNAGGFLSPPAYRDVETFVDLATLQATTVLYSVLASAKANQVKPFAYVRDLLVQLSGR